MRVCREKPLSYNGQDRVHSKIDIFMKVRGEPGLEFLDKPKNLSNMSLRVQEFVMADCSIVVIQYRSLSVI